MDINANEHVTSLQRKACELRLDVVDMISNSDIRSGHFGGSLSAAEIVTVLYWHVMRVDPRTRLGRQGPAGPLQGPLGAGGVRRPGAQGLLRSPDPALLPRKGEHPAGPPDCLKTPGLDTSSGSLGQGLSLALGMALGARQIGKDYQVYALMSDGETQEGMVWEAAMAASHHRVTNLTAVVDNNGLQVDGPVEKIMNIEPLEDKFRAFGWNCVTVDGHDVSSLLAAFELRKPGGTGRSPSSPDRQGQRSELHGKRHQVALLQHRRRALQQGHGPTGKDKEERMINGEVVHPEILKALAHSGHGNQIVIADGHFPFSSKGPAGATRVYLKLRPRPDQGARHPGASAEDDRCGGGRRPRAG